MREEKIVRLVLDALAIVVGNLSEIVKVIESFQIDPALVNLDDLEKKVEEMKRFKING